MAEPKSYTNRELLTFFRSRLTTLRSETAQKYAKTISDLDLFLTGHRLRLADIDSVMVDDFTIELLRRGLSTNTVIRHLNILSSLLKSAAKKGLLKPCDAARDKARELTKSPLALPPLMRSDVFADALQMLRDALRRAEYPLNETSPESETDVYEDMLLFSLLNGVLPMREVAALKKTDLDRYASVSRGIARRYEDVKRDFVFPLRQSYNTPKQIYKAVTEGLKVTYGKFLPEGVEFDADLLSRSLWKACAVKSGATKSEAEKLLITLDDENKQLWQSTVNAVLTHDRPRWYAMHLRKGVDFDSINREIAENVRPLPELFYPNETIRKKVGGKTRILDKPFISNTVFFRSYPEKIPSMFNRIGDKAWCYRVTRAPGSPYAVISNPDMKRFQTVIGIFTTDVDVHPLGELTPLPGESVMVIQAGYGNRQGQIEDVINQESGSTIFRVKLTTDSGYEWRVDLSPHQIELLQ